MTRNAMRRSPASFQALRSDAPKSRAPVWQGLAAFFVLLGVGVWYVHLRSETETLNKEIQRKRRALSVKTKQVENLRTKLESKKDGAYILFEVERRGLGLHPPYPGQVRRVTLEAEPARESEEGLVAQNWQWVHRR